MPGRTTAASLTASDIMTSNPVRVMPDASATKGIVTSLDLAREFHS